MASGSPVGSAPASSRGPGPAAHRPGRSAAMALLEVDRAFPRSARGVLKIARTVVALTVLICFVASGAHEACTALAGMETVITVLFLLLYLLKLDVRMRCLFWPLAVLGLILLVLCIANVVLLWKKISLDKARGRSAPANKNYMSVEE
ncbi:chemokine-like factor isoform X2 [Vidua chalybeata]|uniref:chemokine-like factor isoform X2 n=1 Tax=Vidua chalybeata TaxID=81927 RepID=UPI0023A82BE5|nr:chemokine-like factor isoform X2 [Vidua chalybeata]